jgi:hypothetical protein
MLPAGSAMADPTFETGRTIVAGEKPVKDTRL